MTVITESISELLIIVDKLKIEYPKKAFTLDGRLVGDLGEVLAANAYNLKLYEKLEKYYDAETLDGRKVQIKATMKKGLTFPSDHVPDYYLGIKIHSNGSFDEIFIGPGHIIADGIKHRKRPKNGLHYLSLTILKRFNQLVPKDCSIKKNNIF